MLIKRNKNGILNAKTVMIDGKNVTEICLEAYCDLTGNGYVEVEKKGELGGTTLETTGKPATEIIQGKVSIVRDKFLERGLSL